MKKTTLIFSFLLFTHLAFSCKASELKKDQVQKDTSRVTILATGGTIAGVGSSSTDAGYTAGEKPIEELLNAVPEIHKIANIKGEQIANIGSQDMDVPTWLKLSNRINEIFDNSEADGIVITHGTDTMEETAYFLSLTVHSDKPIVLVGAMRPSTALSQDGNRNLLDAVAVAAAEKSKEIGTVVAMNGLIFTARDVDKINTINTDAFQSRDFGPIGVIHDNKVEYYYQSVRRPSKIFDVRQQEALPEVDILYGYVGARPDAVDFSMKFGARGIVYAGVGNGNFSQEVEKALAAVAREGVVVCRSSRIGSGRVTLENEVDDEKYRFTVADDLSPQKARILLMLALTETDDPKRIQDLIFKN